MEKLVHENVIFIMKKRYWAEILEIIIIVEFSFCGITENNFVVAKYKFPFQGFI